MTSHTTWGRIPVTIVEIDQDQCCLEWQATNACGTCNAGGVSPCFNTYGTCQSVEDFDTDGPRTLRFSMRDRSLGPVDYTHIPSLESVSTSPTRINVGGRQGKDKPLGRRAESKIQFRDHPYSDILTDPYLDQRSYVPLEQGTFWGKLLARDPYLVNRPIRILEGYEGQSLAEMNTRHYIIEKIEGPDSNGKVSVRAQDVLRLADNDKAKAPALSTGRLLADITDSETTIVVTGGTLAHYTAYSTNVLRISDELIEYTAVTENVNGDLEFTGLTRGARRTEADEHEGDDTVQACLEYDAVSPWEVARSLLVDFGNVDSGFIPFSEWESEANVWLSGFTVSRLITEPKGVTQLLGELSEQCLFYIWWDEIDQKIQFRVVRPSIGALPVITEDNALIKGSTSIQVKTEERISQVWVSFLPRNPIEIGENREHYKRTTARVDLPAESAREYGESRVYEIYSPWLETDAQVDLLTFRILARYRAPTTYVKFELDAKDRFLKVGDPFDLEYRGFVDQFGAKRLVRYQVISAHESPPGERIKYEAQKFDFTVGQNFGGWMVSGAPVYENATEQEKLEGFFWSDDGGQMLNGDPGYLWS